MSKKRDKERKQEIKDKLTDGQIEIQPFYHDLRNEIVQPRNIIVETKYFWDKWKPRLGPTLTVIIDDSPTMVGTTRRRLLKHRLTP
jgi:hypothetical protein